jgi:hypothetical protein
MYNCTAEKESHMQQPDFEGTNKLFELIAVPMEERNKDWKDAFYAAFPEAVLRFKNEEQVEFGPDGLPYVRLNLPVPGEPFEPVTLPQLINWITDCGLGVVFNEVDGRPGWIFPYGQMWSFREFGMFELPEEPNSFMDESLPEEVQTDRQIRVGQPSERFLPTYVRQAIRRFMVDGLGVQDEPKVMLMSQEEPYPGMTLVFSLFPEDFEDEEQYRRVMYALRWFLPTSYALTGITKDSPIAENLERLAEEPPATTA